MFSVSLCSFLQIDGITFLLGSQCSSRQMHLAKQCQLASNRCPNMAKTVSLSPAWSACSRYVYHFHGPFVQLHSPRVVLKSTLGFEARYFAIGSLFCNPRSRNARKRSVPAQTAIVTSAKFEKCSKGVCCKTAAGGAPKSTGENKNVAAVE
jgi:hypothetical protein